MVTLDLYLKGTKFESQQSYQLSFLRILVVYHFVDEYHNMTNKLHLSLYKSSPIYGHSSVCFDTV